MKASTAFSASLLFAAMAAYGPARASTSDADTALKAAVASGRPTLLEFGAPWCSACSHTLPVIEAAARDRHYSGRVNVIVVDVDDNEKLRNMYRINSIPVQVFLDRTGNEVKRHFGAVEKTELERMLDQVLVGKFARK